MGGRQASLSNESFVHARLVLLRSFDMMGRYISLMSAPRSVAAEVACPVVDA
jgi:hypothetical protein